MLPRFHRARVGATSYDPAPHQSPPEAIAPPQVSTARKGELITEVRIADNVRALAAEGASYLETVVLTGNQFNPWDQPLAPSVPVISFRVPDARILRVERMGWRFTDPAMHELFGDSMEMRINGQRVVWYRDGGTDQDPVGDYSYSPGAGVGNPLSPVGFRYPWGSITEPMGIHPVYVDSGALFEVLLVQGPAGGDFVGISVRVVGRLRKAAGGPT